MPRDQQSWLNGMPASMPALPRPRRAAGPCWRPGRRRGAGIFTELVVRSAGMSGEVARRRKEENGSGAGVAGLAGGGREDAQSEGAEDGNDKPLVSCQHAKL
eukprot:758063-Hanusia_phi.AAC.3